MTIWFVSDIHLSDRRPKMLSLFMQFLQRAMRDDRPTAIYFLGDIFEYWLGADCRPDFWPELVKICKKLHEHQIQLFFLPGNRDFLLDIESLKMLHWTLLPDIALIEQDGKRILLMHGDLLCQKDTAYQAYRKVAHHPWIKALFLALPLGYRRGIIQKLRNRPPQQPYLDIEKTTVGYLEALPYLKQYNTSVLIHGHVHYPATHLYDNHYQHWIMPDWREQEGNCLILENGHFSKKTI